MKLFGIGLLVKGLFAIPSIVSAGQFIHKAYNAKNRVTEIMHPRKEVELPMKKSTLISIIVVLSAIAGALAAMFVYLRRREAELDEYEQLLFSEDFTQVQAADEATLTEADVVIEPVVIVAEDVKKAPVKKEAKTEA